MCFRVEVLGGSVCSVPTRVFMGPWCHGEQADEKAATVKSLLKALEPKLKNHLGRTVAPTILKSSVDSALRAYRNSLSTAEEVLRDLDLQLGKVQVHMDGAETGRKKAKVGLGVTPPPLPSL